MPPWLSTLCGAPGVESGGHGYGYCVVMMVLNMESGVRHTWLPDLGLSGIAE